MNLRLAPLGVLTLLLLPALGEAQATPIRAALGTLSDHTYGGFYQNAQSCLRVWTPDGDAEIGSITVAIESDRGSEDVTLTESDLALHGVAALSALPGEGAALSLTVFDDVGGRMMSWSGRVDVTADGRVAWTADASAGGCSSRAGCTESATWDIQPGLTARFMKDAGHEMSFNLSGADLGAVTSAALVVTELAAGDGECDVLSRTGCVSETRETSTTVEIVWDELNTVWESELSVAHEGYIDANLRLRDTDGRTLERVRPNFGLPWIDGGEGTTALATDDDPLTSVGILSVDGAPTLTLVSEGWTLGDDLPTHAELELSTGETITIAANSIMRIRKRPELLTAEWDTLIDANLSEQGGGSLRLHINGRAVYVYSAVTWQGGDLSRDAGRVDLTLDDLSAPLCVEGTCLTLVNDGQGNYDLSVSQYRWDTDFIAGETDVTVTLMSARGEELLSEDLWVEFEDEVSVLFSADVDFSGDPAGDALSGQVRLLGEQDRRGRQDTLSRGRFYATVTVDARGELGLAGADRDELAAMPFTNFAVLLQGSDRSCGNDDDGFTWPPPLAAVAGNGSGTKNASTTTSTRPQLL